MKQTGFKPPIKVIADKDTLKHRTRQLIALTSVFPGAEDLIQTLYIAHSLIKHHKGRDVAENIKTSLDEYISADQYQGGSYDGAYFHQSVPQHLNEMLGVNDVDVQSDHDGLHHCGIADKGARNVDENNWVNELMATVSTAFNDHNYGKQYEELKEVCESLDINFEKPKFHSTTRFANSCKKVLNSFYTDLPALIKHYENIKEDNINSGVEKERKRGQHAAQMLRKMEK